ncbi:unnamed protein product [Owenia fusiformis]|uniref:Uncharacterized protein n=1 Tax=Owenia fusiformis TaxID=6347 RepID=A0A8J1XYG3_OWEFU|nr:unnamed protein product [Owenia fusiformis]
MAAPMFFKNLKLFSNIFKIQDVGIQVRNASKKAGGSSRNKRKNTPGKHRRLVLSDGEFAQQGNILCTQLGLKYYPGENVGCAKNATLIALVPGTVKLSTEFVNPYPESPLYQPVKDGVIIKKTFVHVLPDPQHQRFKLKSMT